MAIYLTYSNVSTDNDLDLPGHNLTWVKENEEKVNSPAGQNDLPGTCQLCEEFVYHHPSRIPATKNKRNTYVVWCSSLP